MSVGTDADLERTRSAPAYRDRADEQWYQWPSSPRCNSGEWSLIGQEFLGPQTDAELEPLLQQIRDEDPDMEPSLPTNSRGLDAMPPS